MTVITTIITVGIKGKPNDSVAGGSVIIVNGSGKVKKSGTVKIDGYKYTVDDYVVTDVKYVD